MTPEKGVGLPWRTVTMGENIVPQRIKIESINLDAAIEGVGLSSDGSMDVPSISKNTAWYNLGPRPGDKGSAVIDGHVNWKDGSPAVFADLYKLKPNDGITVEDNAGHRFSFIVRTSRSYDQNANTSDVFGSKDGKAHLNLITCEGVWDQLSGRYPKRLVVFSDLIQ